jgi:fatty acid desaturase
MSGHDDRGRQEPPEYPRSEPEILPPERDRGRAGSRPYVWIWTADGSGMPRATVPGVFAILLAFAFAGLVATVILLVALGAVLFWVPVIILVMSALLLSAVFRQYWRRFQRWAFRR